MARNSDMNRILMLFEVERIRTLKRKVYESALAYQSYCDTSGACEKRIEILMDEVITQEEKFTKKIFLRSVELTLLPHWRMVSCRVGFGMEFFFENRDRDFLFWARSNNSENPEIPEIEIGI